MYQKDTAAASVAIDAKAFHWNVPKASVARQ
jgi:hypothetical protein